MEKRTSAVARILAAVALVAAVVVTVVVISSTVGGNSNSSEGGHRQTTQKAKKHRKRPHSKAATYKVKPGDTLISIAHKTGVTVVELEELNPEVDPLTLNAGEVLKLR